MAAFKIRDSAKNAIKRYMRISESTDVDKERAETLLVLLHEQWERFKEAQQQLEITAGEDSQHVLEEERSQAENWYILAESNLKRIFRSLVTEPSPSKSSTAADVRLPKMDLPTFSGKPIDWVEFRDIYISLIHNNNALSAVQKMHYLRNCLKGDALKIIGQFQLTDSNYPEAWAMVENRFHVERILIDHHLTAMTSIKKVTTDSASAIRSVIDVVLQHMHALRSLARPVEFWDDWIIHLAVSKLAFETRKQWELSILHEQTPTFEELHQFLLARCRSLESLGTKPNNDKPAANVLHVMNATGADTEGNMKLSKPYRCSYCQSEHKIFNCEHFKKLSLPHRRQVMKEQGACFNCLSAGHIRNKCSSTHSCKICKQRHHTLLHPFLSSSESATSVNSMTTASHEPEEVSAFIETERMKQSLASSASSSKPILLATAQARSKDNSGRWQPIRILLDNGSHVSLVSEACVQRLGLQRKHSSIVVTGIGSAVGGIVRGESAIVISPLQTDSPCIIRALIMPKITNNLPASDLQFTSWTHIEDLDLADPQFAVSAPIDVLVGMDEMEKFIKPDMRMGAPSSPIAQRTVFGWVLSGRANNTTATSLRVSALHCDTQLTMAIAKLWELDNLTGKRHLTVEEEACEKHFAETHRRRPDGRFIVELPFKKTVILGESKWKAEKSFLRIEKRLQSNSELRQEYNKFMKELIDMSHMETAPETNNPAYYMPHHFVIKENSLTTKLRVVFNASMRTSSEYSLNDALLVGPQLQQDLFSILARFRSHRYVMSADVEKMYRQVLVKDEHCDYQRILWRFDPSEELKSYRLLRVTYGVASASFLAIKALQEAALQSPVADELTRNVILRDVYVDDVLTGASSEHELLRLQHKISDVLAEGGFRLRKWTSNCSSFMKEMSRVTTEVEHFLTKEEEVHTLGLIWNTQSDFLTYSVRLKELVEPFTKRRFLSDASSLFDPLGLLSPCTVRAKLWFQELWNPSVNWDDPVPDEIAKRWIDHRKDLVTISTLKCPRWTGLDAANGSVELHVFADASEKAYAAAVYVRCVHDGVVSVRLLAAKTKVAPLKPITLPRLELCAAHLAAKLIDHVSFALNGWTYSKFAWTDSMVTLAWVQSHPSRWSTFIANRVAAVQEVLPSEIWSHVPSEHNPADCASRGCSATDLIRNDLWWNGPRFLSDNLECWQVTAGKADTHLELRKPERHVLVAQDHEIWHILTRYSSFGKLKRVIAYVLRFLSNLRRSISKAGINLNPIAADEIKAAETCLLRYVQQIYFNNEIRACRKGEPVQVKSSLARLLPFLDDSGLLRVGGRLENMEAGVDIKHPIILPRKSPLNRLIIADVHIMTLHGGPQMMQTLIQRRFWIFGLRSLVRGEYRKCVKCKLLGRRPLQQRMGALPRSRVTLVRCFLESAVDCAGPINFKFSAGRGSKAIKGYICSFICMATGAMHLELLSDLSSNVFLHAFKRFVNRRGFCRHVFSDNGTNFVGAARQIQDSFNKAMQEASNRKFCAEQNLVWHFNPPHAPHMGGFWETGIKRVKYHLKRVGTNVLLTYEEYYTLLTEIEACVNSRPLCVFAADASDREVLTPGHFIIGEPLKGLEEPDGENFKGNLGDRWRLISAIRQQFWNRWRDEYVVSLQKCAKWSRPSTNLKINDIVAILGERTPPLRWKLGKVMECIPGKDGLTRVVLLRTSDGECLRPIHRLCLLPTEDDILEV